MKNAIFIPMKLLFVLLLMQVPLQQKISYNYTEIPAAQYTHCKVIKYLSNPGQFKVKGGKLLIPVEGKSPKVFKNEGEIYDYEYLGDLKDTKLSLVKCMEPNDEYCYVVNRTTGDVIILLSEPVFAADGIHFVCANNPGTDEKQHIQIGELVDGTLHMKGTINGKVGVTYLQIGCVYSDYVLLTDQGNKYYKLTFKLK